MIRHLFLSLRPEFASKILFGTKMVEFRRTRPRVRSGQPVIVYASSPVMAIVGLATVARIDTSSPTQVWSLFRDVGGIQRSRFREYFKDAREAHAISLTRVQPLSQFLGLAEIRDVIPGFQPPQAFNYMEGDHVLALGLRERLPCNPLGCEHAYFGDDTFRSKTYRPRPAPPSLSR